MTTATHIAPGGQPVSLLRTVLGAALCSDPPEQADSTVACSGIQSKDEQEGTTIVPNVGTCTRKKPRSRSVSSSK